MELPLHLICSLYHSSLPQNYIMQLLHSSFFLAALELEIQNISVLLGILPHFCKKKSQRKKLQNILTHYYVKSQTYTKTEKGV